MFIRRKRPRRSSNTAGSYFPNAFSIQVAKESSIISSESLEFDQNNGANLSVFVHEYWHYLQNLTTVAGFVSLLLQQDLAAQFSRTLAANADGTSVGSRAGQTAQRVEELIRIQDAREGNLELMDFDSDDVDEFTIRGVEPGEYSLSLDGESVPLTKIVIHVEITLTDGSTKRDKLLFGQACVEEGVAYLVDRMVAGAGTGAIGPDDAPPIPYWVLRELAISGDSVDMTAIEIASLGTLALLTTDAAAVFLAIRDDYAQLRRGGETIPVALDMVWQNMRPNVEEIVQQIIRVELPGLSAMHMGRGLVEPAFVWLTEQYESVLLRRLDDPLFDLRPFTTNAGNMRALICLMQTVLPCDAVITGPGLIHEMERDILVTFGQPGASACGYSLSDCLRALESQTHYVLSHLGDDTILATDTIESENVHLDDNDVDPCPFYTSCGLPSRINDSSDCFRSPWRNYKPEMENCWYGTAVSSMIGPTSLRNITRDPRELAAQHERVLRAVKRRAYEIWRERGGSDRDGDDIADWYQARKELGVAAEYDI